MTEKFPRDFRVVLSIPALEAKIVHLKTSHEKHSVEDHLGALERWGFDPEISEPIQTEADFEEYIDEMHHFEMNDEINAETQRVKAEAAVLTAAATKSGDRLRAIMDEETMRKPSARRYRGHMAPLAPVMLPPTRRETPKKRQILSVEKRTLAPDAPLTLAIQLSKKLEQLPMKQSLASKKSVPLGDDKRAEPAVAPSSGLAKMKTTIYHSPRHDSTSYHAYPRRPMPQRYCRPSLSPRQTKWTERRAQSWSERHENRYDVRYDGQQDVQQGEKKKSLQYDVCGDELPMASYLSLTNFDSVTSSVQVSNKTREKVSPNRPAKTAGHSSRPYNELSSPRQDSESASNHTHESFQLKVLNAKVFRVLEDSFQEHHAARQQNSIERLSCPKYRQQKLLKYINRKDAAAGDPLLISEQRRLQRERMKEARRAAETSKRRAGRAAMLIKRSILMYWRSTRQDLIAKRRFSRAFAIDCAASIISVAMEKNMEKAVVFYRQGLLKDFMRRRSTISIQRYYREAKRRNHQKKKERSAADLATKKEQRKRVAQGHFADWQNRMNERAILEERIISSSRKNSWAIAAKQSMRETSTRSIVYSELDEATTAASLGYGTMPEKLLVESLIGRADTSKAGSIDTRILMQMIVTPPSEEVSTTATKYPSFVNLAPLAESGWISIAYDTPAVSPEIEELEDFGELFGVTNKKSLSQKKKLERKRKFKSSKKQQSSDELQARIAAGQKC